MLHKLLFLAVTTLAIDQLPNPTYNTAVVATYNAVQENLLLCRSMNGPAYECFLPHSALRKYQAGQRFDLWPDADCVSACSVNIDRQGIVSIKVKTAAGYVDPGGTAKQPKAGMLSSIWYDGNVFQVY